jgi:pyridoxal phosphate enzyme (YggS family)
VIAERLAEIQARIAAAAARAGRSPSEVTLIAVSKTHPASAVQEAFAAGARVFGENYVQELRGKQEQLPELAVEWHFIGRLQKNKAKDVVGRVALVHTVDSAELAAVLGRRALAASVVQDVLVEVHLGGEASKGGVAVDGLPGLLQAIAATDGVRCRGLMAIPPPVEHAEDNREHFRALAALGRKHGLPLLSMGMSDDFEVAVEEGATHVRVGTAIFGARSYPA